MDDNSPAPSQGFCPYSGTWLLELQQINLDRNVTQLKQNGFNKTKQICFDPTWIINLHSYNHALWLQIKMGISSS